MEFKHLKKYAAIYAIVGAIGYTSTMGGLALPYFNAEIPRDFDLRKIKVHKHSDKTKNLLAILALASGVTLSAGLIGVGMKLDKKK